ncbi:MAG: energy-coupling factor transporter transmembrane protein EcfT [Dehalococcoidales bacterium]|nr:energy-coupling factor transporter transmembrane protein EcfT [Dehalococcoidales bacterium]
MRSLRYQDKETPVHKLNPFSKLAWIGSVLILALILDNPLFLLALFLLVLPIIKVAGIWKEWLSTMKFSLFMCLAIILINALVSSRGSHILFEAPFRIPVMGIPVITLEAILYGVAMSLRLLVIISVFAVLTFTIHPDDMMLAMIKMKLPYKSVLVISLSTRFIPTLVDDTQRITDIQRSRGLELDGGGLAHRIKSRSSIVIALLSNSLDRAVQVAEAMESRAFGIGRGRTFYKDIKFTITDITTVVFALLPGVLGIVMGIYGYGQYQYYPTFERISLNGPEWYLLALMTSLLFAILPLAYIKRRVNLD